jgi:hypothetical protein
MNNLCKFKASTHLSKIIYNGKRIWIQNFFLFYKIYFKVNSIGIRNINDTAADKEKLPENDKKLVEYKVNPNYLNRNPRWV